MGKKLDLLVQSLFATTLILPSETQAKTIVKNKASGGLNTEFGFSLGIMSCGERKVYNCKKGEVCPKVL